MGDLKQRTSAVAAADAIMAGETKRNFPARAKTIETICERISEGRSLRAVCRDMDMPGFTTVKTWLSQDDVFRAQYVKAREEQAEYYADEIVNIADTTEDPPKARLQIDARKWVAAKLLPKKYGDNSSLSLSGSVDVSLRKALLGLADD